MKFNYYNIIRITGNSTLLALLFCLLSLGLYGQEAVKTRMSLSYTQMPESKAYLQAKVIGKVDGRFVPIPKIEVSFYNESDEGQSLLGTAATNMKGIATVQIEDVNGLILDAEGSLSFSSAYDGNDEYTASDDMITMLKATISYDISENDGVRSINLTALALDDESTPLADYEVVMSVPRMFSNLKIAEGYTDENGSVEFRVPEGIPGDEEGNLDVKVQVLEAGDYGNLEVNLNEAWGIPRQKVISANRELWSPNAPIWIVVTFVILMIAVWSHFAIVIWQLYKMSKVQ
jgi:hypothetical protein